MKFAVLVALFGAVSITGFTSAAQIAPGAPQSSAQTATASVPAPVQSARFEDASDKAGIDFTHSFGSRQAGIAAGGHGRGLRLVRLQQLGPAFALRGERRPLDDSMHPYPLKEKPNPPPHNHLYRNDGNGHFTDVTEQSGLNPDMYSMAVTAADYDNDGYEDLLVTGYGKVILYHNDGNGHFTDVTEKAGIKVDGWAISSTWLDYDKDGCVDLFVGRYVKFDPKYRAFYAPDQLSGAAGLRGRDQHAVPQQLRRNIYRCDGQVGHRRVCGPHDGRDGGGLRQRWLGRHLCGQRPHGELPLPQQARWNV
jgi:enediyne biosynthesis protein E4